MFSNGVRGEIFMGWRNNNGVGGFFMAGGNYFSAHRRLFTMWNVAGETLYRGDIIPAGMKSPGGGRLLPGKHSLWGDLSGGRSYKGTPVIDDQEQLHSCHCQADLGVAEF